MVKEVRIIEPREGIDFHTVHVYNNTDQRLVLSLKRLDYMSGSHF